MRTSLLLFTLSICSIAFSQKQSEIDSLEYLLLSSLETRTILRNKLHLSRLLENTDRERSRHLAQDVLYNNSSYKLSDSLRSAAYLRLAVAAYKEKKDSIALVHLNKIDSLFNKNDSIIAPLIHSKFYRSQISKFTFSMDGILAAKKYILEGKRLADIINDPLLQNLMTYQLGEWHGFFSQAEFPEKHLDTARTYFEKVLPYYRNSKNLEYESRVYFSLASIAVYNKNFDKAEKYYLQRLETITKTNDSVKIGDALTALGGYYRRTQQPKKALQKLDEAITIANSKGYSDLGKKGELMHSYALVYEQQGNFKAAMNSLFSELKLRDSLFEDQNTRRGIEMAAKYETKKKEQEIALLTSQNKLATQQKKNQRNLLLGGLGLTTVAGIFLFLGYRNRTKTNDKLRELDEVKSNFFANISHEFRTPLSLISGPIEQQLQKEDITSQERQNLQIAQRNSTRLVTLVDQLLDLSKLESGHFSLQAQEGNLNTFLKSLTSSFEFIAQENNQEYTTHISDDEDTYWFDTDALEKIITNLISNAIKYSPKDEHITVNASVENQTLQVEVKNSGAPLPPEVLTTMFNRFQRADETTAGTGIGLALTKELVTLHKGTIAVSSDTNWTTFTVNLPVSRDTFTESEIAEVPSSEYAFTKAEPTAGISPITPDPDELDIFSKKDKPILLIVDDNKDVRTYVSSLFDQSHTILTAVNGKEGFEKALSEVPDLIITDLMMPEDDGIMLTQNCKTTEATSHIPVLMLTAKAGDENELLGLETGADAYITKPFNTEILKTTVHNLQETRDKLQERFSQEIVLLPKDIATNSADERFLTNLQAVMDKSLIESDFNTEAFAEAVGMSRMQLHRKLKALTGLSATEFIRGQRLKLAAQMLKKSDISVSQVGYAVGFNNHSYFTKCFKEKFGISPSEYSKKP